MRLLALVLLLVPAVATGQSALQFNLGLSYTGSEEPYQEISGSAVADLSGPFILSAGVAQANALYSVDYHYPSRPWVDIDPGFYAVPSTVRSWTTLSAYGGLRLDGGWASAQVAVGPVLSVASYAGDDVLVGGGVGAEVGVLDVYPVPSVGLGLSVHGATTTSHSWAGARLGVRVRL